MQVKNLSFVEKHVEKVAFAGCVVIASLVVGFYVWGDPYSVTVASTGQLATADTLGDPLAENAQRLDAALAEPSPLPRMAIENYADDFRERLMRSKHAFANLEAPMGTPGLDSRVWRVKKP